MDYSYQDNSDMSGILDTHRDSTSEDEDVYDDGKSTVGSESTAGSGSTLTLVDNKENRTPLVGSTPGSRLSSTTQMNRKKEKDRVINVSGLQEKNKKLEETVYTLKLNLGAINKELPWIMIDGVDHLAQYIQFKKDNEVLRDRLAELEKSVDVIKEDNHQMVKQERDRLEREHMEEVANLRAQYERICQECDALREEGGQPLPSPLDMDRSAMSDGSSMWSERSRQCGMYELRIEGLEKDVQAAKNARDVERKAAERTQRELEGLRRKMEEKEREWQSRASIASLQETFHIGIPDGSKEELRKKIDEQLARIDRLEKEAQQKADTEKKLTQALMDMIKQKDELASDLRMAREMSMSVMENGEVDEIMRELLELSEMNSHLQEECRRRGAMRMGRKMEGEREEREKSDEREEIKKELETTMDICDQYQKMGDRLAPLQQRIVAMNKSVMERRSFLEGLKGFEVSGLTPLRLGEGSYNGTPGTPAGRGRSRLLQSVLQKSVLNVSHADILNCSINTSQGIKHAKDKLLGMRESCQKLFEKLQSSYALFDEIRLALGGEENSELARQMAELRLELELSAVESGEAAKAIEVVENSLFELQSMLETSMGGGGRESDFNLSSALRREEGVEEVRRMSIVHSIEMTAQGERQDVVEMREKYSALVEDYQVIQDECDELKKRIEEADMESGNQKKKYGEVHEEREELYREVESRREKEEILIKENQRLMGELEEAIEKVKRAKAEIEETAAKMQDTIDGLESEAFEANRRREREERQKEEEIERMRMSMEEKEAEVATIHRRMEEISKELDGMRDVERKSASKMSRLEREAEAYKENFERTSAEYAKLNEELEDGKKREEELEKRLQKYKYKVMEEAEATRKANEREQRCTQTNLSMEKLAMMESDKKTMEQGLRRLGRTIGDAFLKKEGGGESVPERCLDEMDVNRLVDIVVREKQKKDENNAMMEKTNEQLQRYVQETGKKPSRVPSPGENGDGERDTYTSVGGVMAKYEDPIRQLFFALTAVANNVVQRYKRAQSKMMSGGLSEAEYTHILEMLRDLRGELNDRLSKINQKKESDPEAGDARMALRLAVVMEANDKLNTRIKTLMAALRSNWSAEEKAKLLDKVVAEMNDISKTLKTTVGVKQGRLPSSSSTATASTRKI